MKHEQGLIQRLRRGAQSVRWCLGIVVTIGSAACAPSPEPTHQTVEYYRANSEARQARVAECANDPAGLGKTTLGRALASEMGAGFHSAMGRIVLDPLGLLGLLTRLREGDILFVDEIHGLPRSCEEYLYGALEDGALDVLLAQGARTRAVRVVLSPFTLVGAAGLSVTAVDAATSWARTALGPTARCTATPSNAVSVVSANAFMMRRLLPAASR